MVGSNNERKGAAIYYQVIVLSTWSIHRMLRGSPGARTNSTVMTEVIISIMGIELEPRYNDS